MLRELINYLRASLARLNESVRKHCHLIDLYLRLSWPFVMSQLILFYFLTETGQGRVILLDGIVPGVGGIGVGFFLAALGFSWITWMMTRSVISLAPNRLQRLTRNSVDNFVSPADRDLARFYCYKLPCLSSIIFLVGIGAWLTSNNNSGDYRPDFAILTFLLFALFIDILWDMNLKYAIGMRRIFSVVAPILFFTACLAPAAVALWIAQRIGVYFIALIGFLFLTGLAALLVGLAHRSAFPLFGFLFVIIMALISYYPHVDVDLHEAKCSGDGCEPRKLPVDLKDRITPWKKENQAHPRTMVLVAAAGGGVRAGYWTASVLGAIADTAIARRKPGFLPKIFAISGVSGGALGAAAFAALDPDEPTCQVDNKIVRSFRHCLTGFLAHDFMSPIMASFLTGDLVRRVVPGVRLRDAARRVLGETMARVLPFTFPVDRADALESAWEDAWKEIFDTDQLARPFDELWADRARYHPNFLLNGTLAYSGARSGERAVTSNLRLKDSLGIEIYNPAEFRRLALSTAIDNSTRFPVVEPAGAITTAAQNYYIVDGGYFDNYGAATLLDLLNGLKDHWKELSLDRLIILQISSNAHITPKLDQDPKEAGLSAGNSACRTKVEPAKPWGELLTAYDTAMDAREWSGLAYAEDLRDWRFDPSPAREVKWFHFGLRYIDPPLGWSLSEQWRRCIDDQLEGSQADKIRELVDLLDRPIGPPP